MTAEKINAILFAALGVWCVCSRNYWTATLSIGLALFNFYIDSRDPHPTIRDWICDATQIGLTLLFLYRGEFAVAACALGGLFAVRHFRQ
jgi:hypothetical protein